MQSVWVKAKVFLGDLKDDDFLSADLLDLQRKYQPTFATIAPPDDLPVSVVKFDQGKNVAFCVGIDVHKNGKMRITNDVMDMCTTLSNNPNLRFDSNDVHYKICTASPPPNQTNTCTKRGLHDAFMEYSKKVEDGGNFMFYYTGHGDESQGRCVLVPSDYNEGDESSGISGDDLVQWLNEAQCKAKNILFVFDCCYAGSLGEALTRHKNLTIDAQLHVMCACAAGQITVGMAVLEHSVFTYFLIDYLQTFHCSEEFKVKPAMDTISILCFSFSHLIFIHNQTGDFCFSRFKPKYYHNEKSIVELKYSPRNKTSEENTISQSLLESLLDKKETEQPHAIIEHWLQLPVIKESLQTLNEKASYYETLQKAIFSVLLYSSALLHYVFTNDKDRKLLERNRKLLERKNIFLMIAITVFKKINFHMTIDHLIEGLEYYISAVKEVGLKKVSNLRELRDTLENNHDDIQDEDGSYCRCSMI